MADLQRDYNAFRKGVVNRNDLFFILLRHADEQDWQDVVDLLSDEERDAFRSWAHDLVTGYKTIVGTWGYHGPTEEERGPLRRRFEERGWLREGNQ